jgi:glycerophosphoryl diester phosphodiesterase
MPRHATAPCRTRVRRPIVIGHRGASGYRPEHTLASYWLAIQQGADFIEPDLVSSKDGVLVARHENEISSTTDVAQRSEFRTRRATKEIDGRCVTGFFTEDFSLAELKSLRATERLPELRRANTRFDTWCAVPTLEEVIRLAKLGSQMHGRPIGVYPETKHPSYFAALGLALETPLVRTLHRHGYRGHDAPVFIQSFEVANLKQLHALTDLPLIQLIDAEGRPYDVRSSGDTRSYGDMTTRAGLSEIASYAAGVGVCKTLIFPLGSDGELLAPTELIPTAHATGLLVHAWTFRRENQFLPTDLRAGNPRAADFLAQSGDLVGECRRFLELGLDGIFSDNPDLAVAARNRFGPRTAPPTNVR